MIQLATNDQFSLDTKIKELYERISGRRRTERGGGGLEERDQSRIGCAILFHPSPDLNAVTRLSDHHSTYHATVAWASLLKWARVKALRIPPNFNVYITI